MASLKLKLSNRSPKQPIKNLPASIELPHDATVEDAKIAIARQIGFSDFNRVGLYGPSARSTLKNRKALIRDETEVISAGELVVKDLGRSSKPSLAP
jgi:very-long-chain enoyl-CoA reductase